MNKPYHILKPGVSEATDLDQFALDVLVGLSGEQKCLSSKYFYDHIGDRLFQQIMELPEYYLARSESEILTAHRQDIINAVNKDEFSLIELGAGDGRKTTILIDALIRANARFCYTPIDISEAAIAGLTNSVQRQFPSLKCQGLVGDYFDGIRWSSTNLSGNKLVLFLGSTIGNFSPEQTRDFLRTLWNSLSHGDHVLIGFDLKKDLDIMISAYNDARGVTRQFNLNLLERINRDLGGEFRTEAFQHFGTYDVINGAMKSYLVSTEHQHVNIGQLSKSFEFMPYEAVHLEYSFKFLAQDLEKLAHETGFSVVDHYFDERRYFTDVLWRCDKS